MSMLTIAGAAIRRDPATMRVTREPVNASDAGRDQAGLMHTNQVTEKYKIELSWTVTRQSEVDQILAATNAENFSVTFVDPFNGGGMTTRTFYKGERGADIRSYQVPFVGGTTYKTVSFNLIEV